MHAGNLTNGTAPSKPPHKTLNIFIRMTESIAGSSAGDSRLVSLCPERNIDAAWRELVLEVAYGCAEDSGHSYTPHSQQLEGKSASLGPKKRDRQSCAHVTQIASASDGQRNI